MLGPGSFQHSDSPDWSFAMLLNMHMNVQVPHRHPTGLVAVLHMWTWSKNASMLLCSWLLICVLIGRSRARLLCAKVLRLIEYINIHCFCFQTWLLDSKISKSHSIEKKISKWQAILILLRAATNKWTYGKPCKVNLKWPTNIIWPSLKPWQSALITSSHSYIVKASGAWGWTHSTRELDTCIMCRHKFLNTNHMNYSLT